MQLPKMMQVVKMMTKVPKVNQKQKEAARQISSLITSACSISSFRYSESTNSRILPSSLAKLLSQSAQSSGHI